MQSRRVLAACWVIGWVAVVCALGCASKPEATTEPAPDVTLRDIAPPEPLGPPADPEAEAGSRLAYRLQRVELALDRPLNDVWALIDESALPPLKQAVWENNGLRLGKVSGEAIGKVSERLGPSTSIRQSTLLNITEPTAVRSSDRIARPVPVDLTVPPMNIRREWADSGRFRLLMREAGLAPGGVELELTPQLYQPSAQLLPRTQSQRELDGELFEALNATVGLRPGELMVIGLHWPWAVPETIPNFLDSPPDAPTDAPDTPPAPEGQPDSDDDVEGEVDEVAGVDVEAAVDATATPANPFAGPPALEAPPLPPSIGRALFAGERFGRPVQVLLVISVDDGSVLIESPTAP